jgi:hypothetical protein
MGFSKQYLVLLAILALAGAEAAEPVPVLRLAAGVRTLTATLAPGWPARVKLIELPAHTAADLARDGRIAFDGAGAARIELPRLAGGRDRLFARFQLIDAASGRALGEPQAVTDLDSCGARDFAFPATTSKKGLACIIDPADAVALGVKHANANIDLGALVDWRGPAAAAAELVEEVDGQRIAMDAGYVAHLDRLIGGATERGMSVTAILIQQLPRTRDPANPLLHPKAECGAQGGSLAAFNTVDERGMRHYRAALCFLARRYSDPAKPHGWLTGLVVGNELQSHWVWYNLGATPEGEVVRDYLAAVRIADLAARSVHRELKVYVSLEHHWAMRGWGGDPLREIAGRQLLTLFAAAARAGGDFPWHVAFHPYPEDLFKPAFWQDREAVLNLAAPKITFRNLEVLPLFLAQPQFLYAGRPRRIALTEQGFHCPDGADGEALQAAAYAAAYRKIMAMPQVDFFLYHRHVDHPKEGGLRLGLWTTSSPTGEKPDHQRKLWAVMRAADTPEWDAACAFALPLIGIPDWSRMLPAQELPPPPPGSPAPGEPVVYDLLDHLRDAVRTDVADWRRVNVVKAAGWLAPAIFHHPPNRGRGVARFAITLPALKPGERLLLRFGTARMNDQGDGVSFHVSVGDRELFARRKPKPDYEAHEVELTAWAGEAIDLALAIDPLGNSASDHAAWVEPRIVRVP